MPMEISKSKFKPNALKYFREVEKTGKPIIITDREKPALKIIPFADDPVSALKALGNSAIEYEDPLEPVGLEDWEALKR